MVKRDDRLAALPMRQVGLALPDVLDTRLSMQLEWARELDRKLNRRDVLAAILLASPKTREALLEVVDAYRDATVGQALLNGQRIDARSRRRPGRVPRGGGA
jgi:hypothetical protein